MFFFSLFSLPSFYCLGYETALGLAARGCRVIIADKDNCDQSQQSIINSTGNTNIVTKKFDLASLASVRQLAKEINQTENRLDILINNAGTTGLGNKYTNDGLHIGMQVNHFGSFLLTHLLIGLLKKSAPSRIIFLSSIMAYLGFLTLSKDNLNFPEDNRGNPLTETLIYNHSKLCNTITSNILAKKLKSSGVTSHSLHPGICYTSIYKKFKSSKGSYSAQICTRLLYTFISWFIMPFSKTAEEGAQTSLYLALDKSLDNKTGQFYGDCIRFKMPRKARDTKFANEIWAASEDYVKLTPEERI